MAPQPSIRRVELTSRVAGLILLSVDQDLKINFWEGSTSPTTELPVGRALREIWPDESLQQAVKRILRDDGPVSPQFSSNSSLAECIQTIGKSGRRH